MTVCQECALVYVTHDSVHGSTLSYREKADGGACAKRRQVECDPDVVKRSKLLTELLMDTATDSYTATLPISQDAFAAWHAFDAHEQSSVELLCDVLQVR